MKRVFPRFNIKAAVTTAIAASLLVMSAAHGEIVNGIAAKVGNTVVTINEFNRAYNRENKQALLLGAEAPSKKAVMDKLVDDTLVATEGQRRGIIVTEEEVNDIISEIKRQNKFDDEQMNEQLALEGLTLKDLQAQYSRELMKARLVNMMGAEKSAGITDDTVREFYDDPANRERLAIPGTGSVRLSRLFIAVPASATYKEALDLKNEATRVYEQAKNGVDFQSLLQSRSKTPDKEEMEIFTPEQLLPLLPVETVSLIFSLEEGDVTPPIRVKDGYTIFKIEEKIPEKMLPYEEARENIRGYLFKRKGDEQFGAWLQEKRQMTRIEYMIGAE